MSSAWAGLQNNRSITEIPHYAVNQTIPEDTFFTDKKVAYSCFKNFQSICIQNKINLKKYYFVEPSAGDGCFYDLLPNNRKIGIDINSRKDCFIETDFLKWYPATQKKYVVIGNPPFGIRGALALAFIKRAFLFADIVAFILPMSFYSNGKGSNMKRVENAYLLHNERLNSNSFYLPDIEKNVGVNTVFQVWKKGKKKTIFNDYDVSNFVDIFTVCSSPARLCGLDKIEKYDCYVASTFYKNNIKTVDTFEEVNYGSGYGIIIKKEKNKIKKLLKNADWNSYCSDATNHCKHIRMFHIKKYLFDNGIGIKL